MESITKCTLNDVLCVAVNINFSHEEGLIPEYPQKSWGGEAVFHDFGYMREALRGWESKIGTVETDKLSGSVVITSYNPTLFKVKFEGTGKPNFKE